MDGWAWSTDFLGGMMAKMNDKYAGTCWNELMENETKESLAEMFIDGLDRQRTLQQEVDRLKAARDRVPTDYERQVAEERRAEQMLPRDYSDR
jgi:hypothetical protein